MTLATWKPNRILPFSNFVLTYLGCHFSLALTYSAESTPFWSRISLSFWSAASKVQPAAGKGDRLPGQILDGEDQALGPEDPRIGQADFLETLFHSHPFCSFSRVPFVTGHAADAKDLLPCLPNQNLSVRRYRPLSDLRQFGNGGQVIDPWVNDRATKGDFDGSFRNKGGFGVFCRALWDIARCASACAIGLCFCGVKHAAGRVRSQSITCQAPQTAAV